MTDEEYQNVEMKKEENRHHLVAGIPDGLKSLKPYQK